MDSTRSDILMLLNTQASIMTLQGYIDKKDATANDLSDVWNTMLDLRGMLLKKIVQNPVMQAGGCMLDLKCILDSALGI
jgi:hypothetical protein